MKSYPKLILLLLAITLITASAVLAADNLFGIRGSTGSFTADDMAGGVSSVVKWVQYFLIGLGVYFAYLIFKDGNEGDRDKAAWGFGAEKGKAFGKWAGNKLGLTAEAKNNKKLERIEKSAKTAGLRDLAREKEAVLSIEEALKAIGDVKGRIDSIPLNNTTTPPSGVTTNGEFTEIGTAIDAAKGKIDSALTYVKKEHRSTRKEYRQAYKLIKVLRDEGYEDSKIKKLEVFENQILVEHDKVHNYLEEVKSALDSNIKKKFKVSKTKKGTPTLTTKVTVPDLNTLRNDMNNINLKVKQASGLQNGAYRICIDLADAFEKIYKGEKPTTI